MATDPSLLKSELEQQQEEDLYQQLLLQTVGQAGDKPSCTLIQPQPGLCVKTRSQPSSQKVFVNICQSTSVPPPPELSKDELLELLQLEDPTGYRVPMSLGESHTEMDNSSQACTAYDVVVNQHFFHKCQKDPLFQQFLILVCLEGLESKYGLELSRDWKVLKNRTFFGSVREQNVRTRNKPAIEELHPHESIATEATRPEFTLFLEPPTGEPQYLLAEIHLPGVRSSHGIILEVGEDRLVLSVHPPLFHLDVCHPLTVHQGATRAQFHTHTQVLTVKMPVVSS